MSSSKKKGAIKAKQPGASVDKPAKSTVGIAKQKQIKFKPLKPRRLLRPRNLYLVYETLPSFGSVQLPTKLDVLRRAMYCTLIDKMDQADAIQKVREELTQLYSEYHIDVLKVEVIDSRIKELIVEYITILRDAEYIKDLDYKQKKAMKAQILDTFGVEYDFAIQLGNLFECYDENVLSKLTTKNKISRYDWFSNQLTNKPTGLAIQPAKRLEDLLKRST